LKGNNERPREVVERELEFLPFVFKMGDIWVFFFKSWWEGSCKQGEREGWGYSSVVSACPACVKSWIDPRINGWGRERPEALKEWDDPRR
jgi:hypothetical protein